MSKGNSPAFPCVDKDKRMWTGMNLRDYFALEALNSLIKLHDKRDFEDIENEDLNEFIADTAYAIADAMLDERENYR